MLHSAEKRSVQHDGCGPGIGTETGPQVETHPGRVPASNRAALPALLILCAFALAPLGYPGYFQPHSGFAPVYSLYAWEAAGRPLAWSPPYSQTGPLNGDGALPYFLAGASRYAGLDGPAAVKVGFGLSLLLGATGFYLVLRRSLTPAVSLALALVWAYSPMVLGAVYVRGALGGSLALGLLPWLILTMTGRRVIGAIAGVLIGLAMGVSHLGFSLVAALVVGAMVVARGRRPALWFLGGLAAAVVWTVVPALRQGSLYSLAPFLQFAYPYQLVAYHWGYAVHSLPWGPGVPAPLTLGVLPLGLVAASLTVGPGAERRRAWLIPAALIIALVLLATPPAEPLWRLGLGAILEGPWQLIALATFVLVWVMSLSIGPRLAGPGHRAAAVGLLALILAIPALDVPVTAVAPAATPLASFDGGRILLVRAELHGPLRHGATPHLRLYWQATQPLTRDYTVFVHVLDADGRKWGQRDSWPADGDAPTSTWRPGELVTDDHPVYVDVEGPREGYRIALGLYDLETGERLPLADGTTALELRLDR